MDQLWNSVLEEINKRISKASFETWLKATTAEDIDNTIFIKAPNSFARDWIARHYTGQLSDILTEITGKTYELIVIDSKGKEPSNIESTSSETLVTNNAYDKLVTIVKEQQELLQQQQERLNALEKRVEELEKNN